MPLSFCSGSGSGLHIFIVGHSIYCSAETTTQRSFRSWAKSLKTASPEIVSVNFISAKVSSVANFFPMTLTSTWQTKNLLHMVNAQHVMHKWQNIWQASLLLIDLSVIRHWSIWHHGCSHKTLCWMCKSIWFYVSCHFFETSSIHCILGAIN